MAQFLGAADQSHVPIDNKHFHQLLPSFVVPLGDSRIANEILNGSRNALTGRAQRVVAKHRSNPARTNSALMLKLFQVCLEATEQDEVLGASARPPNLFAIIHPNGGFAFAKPSIY
jgi:hypothetical protein